MPGAETKCESCGTPLWEVSDVPVCGRCLLLAAMERTSSGKQTSDVDATIALEKGNKSKPDFEVPRIDELQELFPDLEFIELLGAGGMGAVYKARQPKLDRFVAVKILSKRLASDEEFVARFQREARAMAKLDHPNIVTIYDFGDRSGYYYFLMEFIDGGDLHQLVAAGKLEPEAVLDLVPQICEAIQFAHEEGITHRDIKPANILLDSKGRVKIADFGLAKILAGPSDTSLTMTGTVMGTPFYMAPEQLTGSDKVDQRADIYSLGVVLYQLLTGVLPQGDFAPPSKSLPNLSSSVDNAVMRALAQDPNLRFSEVREMLNALELVRNERQKLEKQRSKPLVWSAIVLVTAALAVGVVFWKPWESDIVNPVQNENVSKYPITQPTNLNRGVIRGISESLDGFTEDLDLGVLSTYDDIVQIRTAATPSNLQVIALRANGKIVGYNLHEALEQRLEKVNAGVEIRHLGYNHQSMHHLVAIDKNGNPIPIYPDHSAHGTFPIPVEPIVDVRTAEGHGAMLTISGEVIVWGNDFEKEKDQWPMPSDTFLKNVSDIVVGVEGIFVLKQNGEVFGWGQQGAIALPSEISRGISSIGLNDTVLVAIDTESKLWMTGYQHNYHEVSKGEAMERRASALKDFSNSAYFFMTVEGKWKATPFWHNKDGSRKIEAKVSSLHNFPSFAFHPVGGTTAENRVLVWIDTSHGKDDRSKSKLQVETPKTKPGKLRVIGFSRDGAHTKPEPFDISAADGISDFIQVVATRRGGWAALRANGEVVSSGASEHSRFASPMNVKRLGVVKGAERNLTVLDGSGGVSSAHLGGQMEIGEIPKTNQRVVDARTSATNGMLLLDNGLAVPWGIIYSDKTLVERHQYVTKLWVKPDSELLTDVKQIALSDNMAAILKIDGSVMYWNEEGIVQGLDTEPSNIKSIAVSHYPGLYALTTTGILWHCQRGLSPTGAPRFVHGRDGVMNIKGGDYYHLTMYQNRDGKWNAFSKSILRDMPTEIFEAMSNLDGLPPEAFVLKADKSPDGAAFLMWIEPQ